jgi:hypothetical protein
MVSYDDARSFSTSLYLVWEIFLNTYIEIEQSSKAITL